MPGWRRADPDSYQEGTNSVTGGGEGTQVPRLTLCGFYLGLNCPLKGRDVWCESEFGQFVGI